MIIIKEEIIPDAIALKILEERSKRGELKYEQKNAYEHLKKFVKIDDEKAKKLFKELKEIKKLRDRHIVAIINFLPEDKDELKVILHKDFGVLEKEETEKILEIIKKI